MHVLGLYNVVVVLGVVGAASVCVPVSTQDTVGGMGRLNAAAAAGYWAEFHGGAATPHRRVYFPSARARDAASPRESRNAAP